MTFNILESMNTSKTADESLNEDVLLDTPDWLIVCDGATDKTGKTFHGKTGGYVTAHLTAKTIAQQPSGTPLSKLINAINENYALTFPNLLSIDRPSCTFVALDKHAATVHRVGDVSWSDGNTVYEGYMVIDEIHANMRAAYLEMLMLDGATKHDLMEHDPGRQIIFPGLRRQGALRNTASEFSYGAIDGRPVPERFMETWKLDNSVTEVIIATDGYPALLPTLKESEEYLQQELDNDPLRIGKHRGTRALIEGYNSFDDRTYVRAVKG